MILGGSSLLVPAEERRGLPTFVILLLGVLVAVYVVVDVLCGWSRRRVVAAEARQLGLAFSSRDPFHLLQMPFALIRRSRRTFREMDNVLWGRWRDLEVRLFDYSYQESEDEWRRFTGAMAAVAAAWPALVIDLGHLPCVSREQPAGSGEERPVRWTVDRALDLPAQDGELVAEHCHLELHLGGCAIAGPEQAEDAAQKGGRGWSGSRRGIVADRTAVPELKARSGLFTPRAGSQ